jgi:hypothetical protein
MGKGIAGNVVSEQNKNKIEEQIVGLKGNQQSKTNSQNQKLIW